MTCIQKNGNIDDGITRKGVPLDAGVVQKAIGRVVFFCLRTREDRQVDALGWNGDKQARRRSGIARVTSSYAFAGCMRARP